MISNRSNEAADSNDSRNGIEIDMYMDTNVYPSLAEVVDHPVIKTCEKDIHNRGAAEIQGIGDEWHGVIATESFKSSMTGIFAASQHMTLDRGVENYTVVSTSDAGPSRPLISYVITDDANQSDEGEDAQLDKPSRRKFHEIDERGQKRYGRFLHFVKRSGNSFDSSLKRFTDSVLKKKRFDKKQNRRAKQRCIMRRGARTLGDISQGLELSELSHEISRLLNEPTDNETVSLAVLSMGKENAERLFGDTKRIEERGGMMTNDESRRRTPGGVFMTLFKSDPCIDSSIKEKLRVDLGNLKKNLKKKGVWSSDEKNQSLCPSGLKMNQ